MYNVSGKSDETPTLQLQPLDNGDSQPAISDKEKEALEESAIVPPPTAPRSAITTEGKYAIWHNTVIYMYLRLLIN